MLRCSLQLKSLTAKNAKTPRNSHLRIHDSFDAVAKHQHVKIDDQAKLQFPIPKLGAKYSKYLDRSPNELMRQFVNSLTRFLHQFPV
jgi:hypothetical protein